MGFERGGFVLKGFFVVVFFLRFGFLHYAGVNVVLVRLFLYEVVSGAGGDLNLRVLVKCARK